MMQVFPYSNGAHRVMKKSGCRLVAALHNRARRSALRTRFGSLRDAVSSSFAPENGTVPDHAISAQNGDSMLDRSAKRRDDG
jgi:hypothetical protein